MKLNQPFKFVVVVFALAVGGCNLPTNIATPPPELTSTPAMPTSTLQPMKTPTPLPTPVPANLVWFAPNMGSVDYPELFTKADDWSIARDKIDVFKFYTQNLLDDPCPSCGNNTLSTFIGVQAFRKLTEWGIGIAVEVGAVKEWGCTGDEEFRVANLVIQNVQANGGKVSFLAMDEPYIGGELTSNGVTCGYTMEQSSAATAYFVEQVNVTYPDIVIGDIEPYPYFSVSQLEQWIMTLEEKGITLAFFHLDVDVERVRVEGQPVTADLRKLNDFCQMHDIPFGVIFTSNWREAYSNKAYYTSTLKWINTVNDAIDKPQQLIFQSWQGPAPSGANEFPVNLPQNDPENYGHIKLINDGLAVFGE